MSETSSTSRSTSADVIKTFPGVDGAPWLDIVRDGPGCYSVHAVGNPTNPIAKGFILPAHAEEWVVCLQAQQRGWVWVG